MTPNTQQKVVEFIKGTAPLVEQLIKSASVRLQSDAGAKKLIPEVVEALVASHRINETEREKAAELLQDPVQALEILKRTASHRSDEELAKLGTATKQTKYASADSNPFVGRRSSEPTEADRDWFEALGVQ